MPLFSCNLGVEVGQIAVAALVVPVSFALHRFPAFVRFGTPAVSALVLVVSGCWLLERTILGMWVG